MKTGTYSPTNSELYIKVHKVYHINEEKDYIKMRASIFYKQTGELCEWLTRKPKNLKLIYNVVKYWEKYNPYEGK